MLASWSPSTTSVCATTRRSGPRARSRCGTCRGQAQAGRGLLNTFNEAMIHRSKDDRWWTESCLRLRDFVMSDEGDDQVWRQHDLDKTGTPRRSRRNTSKMKRCGFALAAKMLAVRMGRSLHTKLRMRSCLCTETMRGTRCTTLRKAAEFGLRWSSPGA